MYLIENKESWNEFSKSSGDNFVIFMHTILKNATFLKTQFLGTVSVLEKSKQSMIIENGKLAMRDE